MGQRPERRLLWILLALAVLSRLVWVLLVHPPGNFVASDMRLYVDRARAVAEQGIVAPARTMAWQAYGTHLLLALPLRLFGAEPPYTAAGALWGLLGAAAVPLTYLLACRVLRERWQARAAGVAALVWYPNLSTTGYFLSETPFLAAQLASVYWLVVCVQEGRRAWAAGLASAAAFMLRPQSAVFFALAFVVWLVNVRRLPLVRWRQIVGVAVPLALALAFSLGRFRYHTGYWGGIAENANMNLTAGRCHNITTQAFKNQAELRKAEQKDDTKAGRHVGLPGYRDLMDLLPPEHPLALRPAVGESVRFVGYIGDPQIHEEIRARCYAATGLWGQVQYSVVNLMLQWFVARQWPEAPRTRGGWPTAAQVYLHVFQVVVLAPSLVGLGLALRRVRQDPALALLAACLLGSMIIAAIFFGDPRLRTPYDPYAIILGLYAAGVVLAAWRGRRAAAASEPQG